jgi:hypothetical protein
MRGAWVTFAKDPANGLKSYQGGWYIFSLFIAQLPNLHSTY